MMIIYCIRCSSIIEKIPLNIQCTTSHITSQNKASLSGMSVGKWTLMKKTATCVSLPPKPAGENKGGFCFRFTRCLYEPGLNALWLSFPYPCKRNGCSIRSSCQQINAEHLLRGAVMLGVGIARHVSPWHVFLHYITWTCPPKGHPSVQSPDIKANYLTASRPDTHQKLLYWSVTPNVWSQGGEY